MVPSKTAVQGGSRATGRMFVTPEAWVRLQCSVKNRAQTEAEDVREEVCDAATTIHPTGHRMSTCHVPASHPAPTKKPGKVAALVEDLMLLWLWWLAAAAPIQSLAWEPLYVGGAAF